MPIDLAGVVGPDYLLTALVVVLVPGAGVLYTLANGLFAGARGGLAAALGCTIGIVPHLAAALLGLAALLHASAVAFQVVKMVGVAYLIYLAVTMWRHPNALKVNDDGQGRASWTRVATRGVLVNILNPKLSLFFLAFLPQFVPPDSPHTLAQMSLLGGVFMLMTLVVFAGYGLAANAVRHYVLASERLTKWIQRAFAAAFAAAATRLALDSH
ncbi:LysE family translocator [Roseospirillum parvum]|uniref:Threonine/homoserine/homoserine lactone efflux protein n=1 Tax=Roseospirillum parvum TaxID=83401 RepID=A0A1G7UP28_9PROT|nr:LysE family translocator [Roseospirillum parvum]SDG49098.1 Threonine/homoserine/homoserine lactone efflux protein [Roseospirillum parvum]